MKLFSRHILTVTAVALTSAVPAVAAASGTTGPLARWYTGPLAPGAEAQWHWNNAGSTSTYKVGLAPSGAREPCEIQVTRTWDVQQPSGEREFHFVVKNTGNLTCGANVLLQSQAASNTWSVGSIAPGVSRSWTWNNANPLTASHFVNVAPSGATAAGACEIEVLRTWYVQQPGGERELHTTVKNVGAIACSGTVLLATNTSAASSWSTGTIAPGSSSAWYWNNANPVNRVYVPGLSPLGATSVSPCALEITSTTYVQELDSDGTNERRFRLVVKNVGPIACSGTILLNRIDPNNTNPLPVPLFPQETSMWCWAASGQMVMSYLGGMISQCEQANARFMRTDCCDKPAPGACVLGGWPDFTGYGFTADQGGALSWADLQSQIDVRRVPFAFSWKWDGGGGHMMVVTGYKVINGQNWVTINDPWAPDVGSQRDILYSDYVDGSGYSHWRDYYNVTKN